MPKLPGWSVAAGLVAEIVTLVHENTYSPKLLDWSAAAGPVAEMVTLVQSPQYTEAKAKQGRWRTSRIENIFRCCMPAAFCSVGRSVQTFVFSMGDKDCLQHFVSYQIYEYLRNTWWHTVFYLNKFSCPWKLRWIVLCDIALCAWYKSVNGPTLHTECQICTGSYSGCRLFHGCFNSIGAGALSA